MQYALSTKYKYGKIFVDGDILVNGGDCYKNFEGWDIQKVLNHFQDKCTKSQLKTKLYTPKLYEVPNGH